jgi:alkylation response protein AidB-like acyl-CoA dehydrogenase
MDFSFTEEQQLLEDTVRRFVAKDYAFEQRRAILASAEGWSREAWQQIADLGLLALNVPEEHGGLGAGPVDTLLAMNALGPGLPLEPYLASAVVATALLRECPPQGGLLAEMAAGERIVVLAHTEPAGAATVCRPAETDFLLDGRKCVVAHAAAADMLVVSARLGDELALFLVPTPTQRGLSLAQLSNAGRRRAADLRLAGVQVLPRLTARLAAPGQDCPRTGRSTYALAALCAEAVGIMKPPLLEVTARLPEARASSSAQPIGKLPGAAAPHAADMLLALPSRPVHELRWPPCAAASTDARRTAPLPSPPPRPTACSRHASSASRRCNCMAAWASPTNSTSATTSSASP